MEKSFTCDKIITMICKVIMLITSIKQVIIIHNFNFDEKSLIRFKKFNENDHIASTFKKSKPN